MKPRKNAAQERSRATVDALVEATARILVREGFDKASTNRIAEVAGVSVGSLYQYFPCKEALVAAVAERHQQEVMQTVRTRAAGILEWPVRKAIRQLIVVAIEAHRVDPRLHDVLAEQVPRVGKLARLESFSRENYALFRSYLEAHREEIRVDDLDVATFVCVTAIEALAHNAVLHPAEMLPEETSNRFVDECARLVCGYLRA